MKRNEIKRTEEVVVRVEYVAEDGTVFHNQEECEKYEESALFSVSSKLKRLNKKWISQENLFGNCRDEEKIEIFDVQTEEDLENLRRYLYLSLTKYGASESSIQDCFTSTNEYRKDYVFENVTIGHEVIIFWGYDCDWFWVYKDGSLDGYFNWVREKYAKILAPEEETK